MDERAGKACWGVTVKAIFGFAGLLMLIWLIGGSESASLLAAG